MTTMRERIARRLCEAGDDWTAYLGDADAVLAELRTPTEAMLNAARDWSYAKYGTPIGNDAAIGCLQAMIDAAGTE